MFTGVTIVRAVRGTGRANLVALSLALLSAKRAERRGVGGLSAESRGGGSTSGESETRGARLLEWFRSPLTGSPRWPTPGGLNLTKRRPGNKCELSGPRPVVARAVLGHTETTKARTRLRARAVVNSAGWDTVQVSAAVRDRGGWWAQGLMPEREQCRSHLVGGEG
eukprot:scaffold98368_cov61-Phaeocystis_antarctica.AAC.4